MLFVFQLHSDILALFPHSKAPLRGNCNGALFRAYHLIDTRVWNYYCLSLRKHRIGNSKKGTGTDKITANSRSSSGKGQMLFERCSSCCCYCVKSEFFCPRWLNEKLFASNNRRTKDVACDSWQKAVVTDFCVCRAFLLLFERQKGDKRD